MTPAPPITLRPPSPPHVSLPPAPPLTLRGERTTQRRGQPRPTEPGHGHPTCAAQPHDRAPAATASQHGVVQARQAGAHGHGAARPHGRCLAVAASRLRLSSSLSSWSWMLALICATSSTCPSDARLHTGRRALRLPALAYAANAPVPATVFLVRSNICLVHSVYLDFINADCVFDAGASTPQLVVACQSNWLYLYRLQVHISL